MKTRVLIGLVFVLALAVVLVVSAGADDGSMFNWYDECGYTCYQWADGSGDCYPCQKGSDICRTPTDIPTKEPTDVPPEKTPTPEPTLPPPPEKPKCNRGLGNGPEGCDPGNSTGKPGAAGEDNE